MQLAARFLTIGEYQSQKCQGFTSAFIGQYLLSIDPPVEDPRVNKGLQHPWKIDSFERVVDHAQVLQKMLTFNKSEVEIRGDHEKLNHLIHKRLKVLDRYNRRRRRS